MMAMMSRRVCVHEWVLELRCYRGLLRSTANHMGRERTPLSLLGGASAGPRAGRPNGHGDSPREGKSAGGRICYTGWDLTTGLRLTASLGNKAHLPLMSCSLRSSARFGGMAGRLALASRAGEGCMALAGPGSRGLHLSAGAAAAAAAAAAPPGRRWGHEETELCSCATVPCAHTTHTVFPHWPVGPPCSLTGPILLQGSLRRCRGRPGRPRQRHALPPGPGRAQGEQGHATSRATSRRGVRRLAVRRPAAETKTCVSLSAAREHAGQVAGVDRFSPGHLHGSSHGQSRITRLAYNEGAAYVPLLRRSLDLVMALQRESGKARRVWAGAVGRGCPVTGRGRGGGGMSCRLVCTAGR